MHHICIFISVGCKVKYLDGETLKSFLSLMMIDYQSTRIFFPSVNMFRLFCLCYSQAVLVGFLHALSGLYSSGRHAHI